jgi:hypothetical protein
MIICRRDGTGFNQMLVTARELAEEMETPSAFESSEPIRPRRKKRQFDYEPLDQPILDAEKQFETGFVNVLLDVAIQSIENRFQLMKSHGDHFSMFYDIAGKKFKDVHYVEKVCSYLQILLTDGAHSDISGVDLKDEIIDVSQHLQSSMTPLGSVQSLVQNRVRNIVSEHHYCFEDTAYHACNCCWR